MDEIIFNEEFEKEIFDFIENSDVIIENENKPLNDYYNIISVKHDHKQVRIILKKLHENEPVEINLSLKGKWTETNFEINDNVFVNCHNYNEFNNTYELNDEDKYLLLQNFIVLEPEIILGSTLIKYGFPCRRRAMFTELYKTVNKNNKMTIEILTGVIVHEIFEYIVIKGDHDLKKFPILIEESIRKHHLELALLNCSIEECRNIVKEFIDLIWKYFNQFIVRKDKIEDLVVTNVLSSEKLYQSQIFGIKGIMDLIVEAEIEGKRIPIPMELKTGKTQKQKDVIQVMIYCLLLCDNLCKTNYSGILVYLKSYNTYKVKLSKRDLVDVLTLRNNLAKNFKEVYTSFDSFNNFPTMYQNIYECNFCFVKDICFFNNMAYEKPNEKDIEYSNCNTKKVLINESIKYYYNYFLRLINQENNITYLEQKKLFNSDIREVDTNEYFMYQIQSIKENENSIEIVLENKEVSLENEWYIESLNDFYILYDPINNTVNKGMLMNKIEDESGEKLKLQIIKKHNKLYESLSKLNNLYVKSFFFSNYSFKLMRGNLVSFILYGTDRLKELIIDLKPPLIEDSEKDRIIKFILVNYQKEFANLNKFQQFAVIKALLSKDYTLIMGFPGSGKTTVIALIIDILIKLKKRVLVTALTNNALDNILVKLKQKGINFARISNNEKVVDPQIRKNILKKDSFSTMSSAKEMLETTYVYGATVSGINHVVFGYLNLDYCIIDEACQILEPLILGALMLCEKFILVGDPYQLNAIIRGEGNAPMSLFERLYSNHIHIGVQLYDQYRMNEDILLLSNECVYDKNMKCANIDISNQKLKINFSYLEQICSLDWLKHALNPDHSVVFLDYSKYCLSNNISLDQIKDSNQIEADFIGKLVHYLQKLRYDYNNLSIITPYKNQETLIKKNLSHIRQIDNNIITIDKSQGIEKEMIIISFVKTNKKTKILKDIQRINVAFTRSKSKLIVIGLVEYLECVENLRKYIEIIRNKKWIYEIK